MQIELLSQSYHENAEALRADTVHRRWNALAFVAEGAYAATIREMQMNITVGKNEIALLPAGTECDRRVLSPVTCFHIAFRAQADHPFYLAAAPGKLHLPREQAEAILETVKRAFLLPNNSELLTHVIEHVFAENYLFGQHRREKQKRISEEVEEAVRYMRRNFDRKIDMDELAERVFLSHSGLIWKFRQELNTTPSAYLSILRLDYAKQLLLNDSHSVTEISELCGYSNPYYFTNAFRRHTGMSPTAFRKYYLKEK